MATQGRPKTEMVIVQCTNCNTDIEKYPSDIKRNKTGRFFCSAECRNIVGSKPKTGTHRNCLVCGTGFYVRKNKSEQAKYCSRECSIVGSRTGEREERTCAQCGDSFEILSSTLRFTNTGKFCTTKCLNLWRREQAIGTKKLSGDGYVLVFQPDSPMAQKSTGLVFEHRHVMSEKLGRALLPHENVHHINGVRHDNRPENLELWSTSQPYGQRVDQKLEWATAMLEEYGFTVTKNIKKLKRYR